ncbi:MAG: LEPR-XLL domain-containing protein, partial [Deltaproteobacteria bacterium]
MAVKKSRPNSFQLEPLEPRLLLSGDGVSDLTALPTDVLVPEQTIVEQGGSQQTADVNTFNAASEVSGLLENVQNSGQTDQTGEETGAPANTDAVVELQQTAVETPKEELNTPDTVQAVSLSEEQNPILEQLTDTLYTPSGPPADSAQFLFTALPGTYSLQLDLQDPSILQVINTGNGRVEASQSLKTIDKIVITGSQEGSNGFVFDFSVPFYIKDGVVLNCWQGWFNTLLIKGNRKLSATYTPQTSDSGEVAVTSQDNTTNISFSQIGQLGLSTFAAVNILTGSGNDDLQVARDGDSTVVSGSQGGQAFVPVSLSDIETFSISTGEGRDCLVLKGTQQDDFFSLSDDFFVSLGESAFCVSGIDFLKFQGLGGNDTFHIRSSHYYPVEIDGGTGNDQVTVDSQGQQPVTFSSVETVTGEGLDDKQADAAAAQIRAWFNQLIATGMVDGLEQLKIEGISGTAGLIKAFNDAGIPVAYSPVLKTLTVSFNTAKDISFTRALSAAGVNTQDSRLSAIQTDWLANIICRVTTAFDLVVDLSGQALTALVDNLSIEGAGGDNIAKITLLGIAAGSVVSGIRSVTETEEGAKSEKKRFSLNDLPLFFSFLFRANLGNSVNKAVFATGGASGPDKYIYCDFSAGEPQIPAYDGNTLVLPLNYSTEQASAADQAADSLYTPNGPPQIAVYVLPDGASDTTLRLDPQDSSILQLIDNASGETLFSQPLSSLAGLTIYGADNTLDRLTIDFSTPFALSEGIYFSAGTGYDALIIKGTASTAADYNETAIDSGWVRLSDGSACAVTYTGVEPVYLVGFGSVVDSGLMRYGNSPAILNVTDYTLASGSTLEIEIGGLTPGPGTPLDNGYDQINASGLAALAGDLQITLINGFTPVVGQTFDFLTFGSISGAFASATGLAGWGDGTLYFDIVQSADRLQLVVKQVPGGAKITSPEVNAVAKVISTYFPDTSKTFTGSVSFGGFVDISGSIGIAKDGTQVKVVAQDVNVVLGNSSFSAGITNGSLAVILNTDLTRVIYATGTFTVTGGNFVNATGTVTVKQNTTTTAYTDTPVTIGAITVHILDAGIDASSVEGSGLTVQISDFVNIGGNFKLQKTGNQIQIAVSSAYAKLTAGSAEVGVSSGTLALVMNDDGTKALSASGTLAFTVSGFIGATGTVSVSFNNTSTDYSDTPLNFTVGGTSVSISSAIGTQAVTVTGFNVTVSDFVTLSGDFGFKKDSTEIIAVATNVGASLGV